jgi:NitT/TauT family transport system permease protein
MSRIFGGWFQLPRGLRIVVVLAGTLVFWEFACRVFAVRAFLLPPPSTILVVFYDNMPWLLGHALYTLEETILGFVYAVVAGVILAILIISRFLEETLYVLLVTLNSIPKVAIAPLFVVWMGNGVQPKVAIAATIAVFVIVVDLVLGLRSVDPEMLDLARSFKGSWFQTLVKIRFPHALPHLFAGMKVGITLALIGAIVGEFVASDRGLGYVILLSQGQFETATMFAAVVLLSIMGTALFFIVDVIERLALPWHVSRRREEPAPPVPLQTGY